MSGVSVIYQGTRTDILGVITRDISATTSTLGVVIGGKEGLTSVLSACRCMGGGFISKIVINRY